MYKVNKSLRIKSLENFRTFCLIYLLGSLCLPFGSFHCIFGAFLTKQQFNHKYQTK